MVVINPVKRELTAKIVYYGPGLCGKTTNLKFVYEMLDDTLRGKMLSLATEADRTLFFDFLPVDMGEVKGFRVRMQLYTVPGQVFYEATRKRVLMGADGVVFVADSQKSMWDANIQSFAQLQQHLQENGIAPDEIPIVLQYNKRDLPDIATVEELDAALNPGSLAFYEAMAHEGVGVEDTLRSVTKQVLKNLLNRNAGEKKPAKGAPPAPPAPPPPPKPPQKPADTTVMMDRNKLLAELGIAGAAAKKGAKAAAPVPIAAPAEPGGELFETPGESALLGGGDSLILLGDSASSVTSDLLTSPEIAVEVAAPPPLELFPAEPMPIEASSAAEELQEEALPLPEAEPAPSPEPEALPLPEAAPPLALTVGEELTVAVTIGGKPYLLRLRIDPSETV